MKIILLRIDSGSVAVEGIKHHKKKIFLLYKKKMKKKKNSLDGQWVREEEVNYWNANNETDYLKSAFENYSFENI